MSITSVYNDILGLYNYLLNSGEYIPEELVELNKNIMEQMNRLNSQDVVANIMNLMFELKKICQYILSGTNTIYSKEEIKKFVDNVRQRLYVLDSECTKMLDVTQNTSQEYAKSRNEVEELLNQIMQKYS